MLNTFTIKKNDGTTDVTFALQGSNGNSASYIDTTSSLAAPRLAKISHVLKATGADGSDRHTVQFQTVVLTASGLPKTISGTFTLTVPRSAEATDTLVKDVVAYGRNYLALSGVIDALIDGILP